MLLTLLLLACPAPQETAPVTEAPAAESSDEIEHALAVAQEIKEAGEADTLGTIFEKCGNATMGGNMGDNQSMDCHLGKGCTYSIWISYNYCMDLPKKCGGTNGCECRQSLCDGGPWGSEVKCQGDISKCK